MFTECWLHSGNTLRGGEKMSKKSTSQNYDNVMSDIIEKYEDLPPVLRKVADSIIQNPEEASFLTLQDLSDKDGIMPSAYIRFAKQIEFSGFKELQSIMQQHFRSSIPSYKSRVEKLKDNILNENLSPIQNAGVKSIAKIETILETVPQEDLDSFVDNILKNKTIYLYARGRSEMVMVYFRYAMLRLNYNIVILPVDVELANSYIENSASNDAFFTVSFKDYSEQTKAIFNKAYEKGLNIFTITDFKSSPISKPDINTLYIQDDNMLDFPRSQVGVIMLIDAMLQTIAIKGG